MEFAEGLAFPGYGADGDEGHGPAEDYGGHYAEQAGHAAGLECADFIGRTDEYVVDGRYATLHVFGCKGLQERAADDHADAVEHSTHGEKEERDPKIGRQRKQNHAHAEAGHTGKQYAAHVFAYRVVRYINSHKHGTYAGRGAEKAKTGSAYVQHHVGKVGQQCDGAAEQYGKKIERNGAQDKLIAEHKAQTLAYLFRPSPAYRLQRREAVCS